MMRGLIRILQGTEFRAQLFRGGAGSVCIKAANLLLTVVLTVVLARTLGTDGYGIYAYVFAIIQILCIPAQLGFPVLIVREVAAYQVGEQWGHLKGLLKRAPLVIAAISAVLAMLAAMVGWWLSDGFTSGQLETLGWGLLLLPMIALGALPGAALRGLHHIVKGQLPEFVIRPGIFLILVFAFWFLLPADKASPELAMVLHVFSALVAFLIGGALVRQYLPDQAKSAAGQYETVRWIRSGAALSLVAGMQVINSQTAIIVLGMFADAATVGIYRVSVQGALLVAFGLQIINMVVAPQFSRLYAQADMGRLRRLVVVSARMALGLAAPTVVLFVLFGDWILMTVFGQGFEAGHKVLSILSIGQVVNAAVGSVVVLLYMTNHESIVARVMAITAVLNIVLNFVLIPLWGMEGAALATSFTLITWNLLLARAVREKFGFSTWALTRIAGTGSVARSSVR